MYYTPFASQKYYCSGKTCQKKTAVDKSTKKEREREGKKKSGAKNRCTSVSLSPKHHHHQVQLQLPSPPSPSSSSSRFSVQLNSPFLCFKLYYYCTTIFSFLFLGWQTTTGKRSVSKCSPGSDDADGVDTTETDCQITIFPLHFCAFCSPFSVFLFCLTGETVVSHFGSLFTLSSFCRCKIVFLFCSVLIFACFLFFIFKCNTDNVF